MKVAKGLNDTFSRNDFISHMVQMKVIDYM